MHQFDAGQQISSRTKRFKVEHRYGHALNGTMELLDKIVEILDLLNLDRQLSIMIDPIDSHFVVTNEEYMSYISR
jgi:hypothetical protein